MSKEKSLTKNLSWTTIGMVLYNMAIWVFSALILRMLGAEASGYYAIACSIGNSLYAVSLWGMRSYIVSDVSGRYSTGEYMGARLGGIGITLLLLAAVTVLGRYDAVQSRILILYSLFKCSEAVVEVLDCFCQRGMQMDINARSMVLRSVLFIVVFYGALRFFHSMDLAFGLLCICTLLVFALFNLRKVRSHLSADLKPVWNRSSLEILKQCMPIMVFELLAALVVAIPRLFFERIGLKADLGIYTSIYTMVVFLQLVTNVLIYTFAPYMAKCHETGDAKGFRKYTVMLFGLAVGLGLLAEVMVVVMGRPVMSLLFGAEAGNHYGYLYLGIVSGVTLAFTWIVSQLFVIRRMVYGPLICSVISTAACVLFSSLLVRPDACDTMSLVLVLTNLTFLAAAGVLLRWKNRRNAV